MKWYPLQFKPIYQYRLWGGTKLRTVLHKDIEKENIGESWEISAVPGNETPVAHGFFKGKTINEIIKKHGTSFLGSKVTQRYGLEFPLLIKFIDANLPLSIQVHPDDDLARERHNSYGKNEMWYIMQSDDNAHITMGFNTELSPATYQKHLENNTIEQVVNKINVTAGDAYYIPTGRIHAIGAGVLLAEIQQSSDITYRIYDYNRVDAQTGNKRELHTQESKAAIDFNIQSDYKTHYKREVNRSNKMISTDYFTTRFLHLDTHFNLQLEDRESFTILMCTAGNAIVQHDKVDYELHMGQTIMLPATLDSVIIKTSAAQLLETFL